MLSIRNFLCCQGKTLFCRMSRDPSSNILFIYYIIYNALTSTLYEYKSYPKRRNYIAHKFHIHAETLDWKRLSVSTTKNSWLVRTRMPNAKFRSLDPFLTFNTFIFRINVKANCMISTKWIVFNPTLPVWF